MLDNQFDDIIRKKISNWEHNSLPDWNAFNEKRKSQEVVQDDSFDELIKQKIHNYTPTAEKINWQNLKNKYDRTQAQKSRVISLKSLELLILLILLFPLTNKLADQNLNFENNNLAQLELGSEVLKNNAQAESALSTTNALIHDVVDQSFNQVTNNELANDTVLSSNEKNRSDETISTLDSNQLKEDNAFFAPESQISQSGLLPLEENSVSTILADDQQQAQLHSNINQLPTSLNYLDLDVRNIAIDFSELSGSQEVNPKETSDWLSISGGIQNNIINSPADIVYGIQEHQNFAPGYSFGLTYSKLFGRFEVASGFVYSRTKYEPYPISETYEGENGIRIISLKDISLDQFRVPLDFKYHALVDPDWSIYFKAGISANLLWKESYTITDELDIPLPRQPGSVVDPNQALLYSKSFSGGFKGDLSFNEALFFNGFVGLGIERKISERTRFFMSGSYSQQLSNTLGPNRDKINVASFETGVKLKI